MIDTETYKLTDSNYHKEVYDKTQIVIGHTFQKNMLHYVGWVYRLNGKNKKTATFTITKEGKVFQHYDPIYYSTFINKFFSFIWIRHRIFLLHFNTCCFKFFLKL